MPTKGLTLDDCMPVVRAYAAARREQGDDVTFRSVGAAMGQDGKWVGHRIRVAKERFGVSYDQVTVTEPPTPEELETLPDGREIVKDFAQSNREYVQKARRAKHHVVCVPAEPFAVAFVGDPHVDNKGCDLAKLAADIEMLADTGTRAINMGDVLDNFHHRGRLAGLQANNRMTIKQGFAVARWLIRDSKVRWNAHLIGNHDKWAGDAYAEQFQGWARAGGARFYNWWARITYKWDGGSFTVDAAHDFPGHSIYNPLHANMRRALQDGTADLYVAGHRHNFARSDAPNDYRGRHYWHMRVSGYKAWDEFADEKDDGSSN